MFGAAYFAEVYFADVPGGPAAATLTGSLTLGGTASTYEHAAGSLTLGGAVTAAARASVAGSLTLGGSVATPSTLRTIRLGLTVAPDRLAMTVTALEVQ